MKAKVLGRDLAFTDEKTTFKRILIDNVLDERFFVAPQAEEEDVPSMVDPHEIIYFFKSEVQVAVQEQYQEVCE